MTGIFFDIDDTLYSRRALLIQAAEETYVHAAGPSIIADRDTFPGETFLKIFYIKSDENFSLVESGAITAEESNVWRLEQTFLAMGLPCPPGTGSFFARRYTYLQNHITLSPVLEDMFTELAAYAGTCTVPADSNAGTGPVPALRLGVLTNGPSDHQWNKYRMLGLERYIPEKYVVVSADAGFSKPEKEIFRAAEKVIGLPPERLWLVGDSKKHDIEGAKSAGWHTVWLDRSIGGSSSASADITVRSEKEMADALMSIAKM